MKRSLEISALIDELNGGTAVARALNEILPSDERRVDREAVYKWKEANRAPYRIRPYLAQIALDAGKQLPEQLRAFAPHSLAKPSRRKRGEQ